ncbi:MAG: glutathione S-transferase family protein [Pseudomonadota bacterium]
MKLYDMTKAVNPRRVRMFLAEKGVEVDKIEVDIVAGENLKDDYLAVNPRGLLPTLVLDDGTAIGESVAICRYIEEIYPDPPLMGVDAKDKALIEAWQRQMEFDGLASVALAFRNSSPFFKDRAVPGVIGKLPQSSELAARGRVLTERFFADLDQRLAQSEFVAGPRFTIADITAYVTCAFARWVELKPAENHVHTQRWYEAVAARPSAKA